MRLRATFAFASLAVWMPFQVFAQVTPVPTVTSLANAYRDGDREEFDRLLLADSVVLRGFQGQVLGRIDRQGFLSRIEGCEITHVFVSGVNYQRRDGIQWTCRGQELANDRCRDQAWGAHTRLASKSAQDATLGVAIEELIETYEWSDARCGRPPMPAPPAIPRTGN